jgi:hypothetical protein
VRTKYQFSIRGLLFLLALASIFLALRTSYVFGHELSEVIRRAHQLPPLIATLAVLICIVCRSVTRMRSLVLVGLCTSFVVVVTLVVEIAEGLRKGYGYWNWWNDLPTFFEIVGAHAAIGGAIGLGSAVLLRVFPKRFLPNSSMASSCQVGAPRLCSESFAQLTELLPDETRSVLRVEVG